MLFFQSCLREFCKLPSSWPPARVEGGSEPQFLPPLPPLPWFRRFRRLRWRVPKTAKSLVFTVLQSSRPPLAGSLWQALSGRLSGRLALAGPLWQGSLWQGSLWQDSLWQDSLWQGSLWQGSLWQGSLRQGSCLYFPIAICDFPRTLRQDTSPKKKLASDGLK